MRVEASGAEVIGSSSGWAGDAGELTGNPALWQVRAELSAAMMLAAPIRRSTGSWIG
ncbi:hypothetical protein [Saccharopolyspora spinosa]|uniref:hypothetical protein n=1 Tax=Saccharopolyspora spinosa TaxID=60894 RepID=UPI00376EC99E